MKFLTSQLSYWLTEREARQNLRVLLSYLAVLAATVTLFSVLFHVIMVHEGQEHSWITGFYWTLTVMSTLGFGDITFQSDLGRAFSIVVLLSGIVLLLIVLPFAFIRFFYAPWLEAQVRLRAPRAVRSGMRDHVIVCRDDEIATGLISRFERLGIAYVLIEPDPVQATSLHAHDVSVVTGEPTAAATYRAVGVERASLVFANLGDAANSNVTLAVRDVSLTVPVLALVEEDNAIDVLELSGASQVLSLKRELGEHLARRVSSGTPKAHPIGRFEDLVIAEFPIENTSFSGRTIRDTRLREVTGLSIVAVWEQGKLLPAGPDTVLSSRAVPVVAGTEEQVAELDALFVIYLSEEKPVLVIGGGKVGVAAARALRARDIEVTILEKAPALADALAGVADHVVIGDAADLDTVMEAGLKECSSVLLTTNDDATNIFLAVYCRRLNPEVRIVSRITEDWNLEAIYRAGADFALSHGSLAAKSVLAAVQGSDLVILGEGADVFVETVPASLEGKTLAQSRIGAETGMTVMALRTSEGSNTNPAPGTMLSHDAKLVMLGTTAQLEQFARAFRKR